MGIHVVENRSIAELTTLHCGGAASYYVAIHSEEELLEALAFAREHNVKTSVIGGGSNVLARDMGFDGLLMHMMLKGIEVSHNQDKVLLTAQAGELLDDVVAFAVEHGWWGIENLSHIPGSVGATPIQNVGAYGVEIKDVVISVRVCNKITGEFLSLDNAACAFGYRDSIFKHELGASYVVTAVIYALSATPAPHLAYRDLHERFVEDINPCISDVRQAVIDIRSQKFPNWNVVGTAGSFFKNPIIAEDQFLKLKETYPDLPGFPAQKGFVKISLGWVLDKLLHARGFSIGPVRAYEHQALVIVAEHGATSSDIENFANTIAAQVKEKIGIAIEWEVSQI